jgi:hypothetical protein
MFRGTLHLLDLDPGAGGLAPKEGEMNRSLRTRRPGFSRIDLLLVVGIVVIAGGLVVVGIQKVREAAARTQSMNNLKQMGLAVLNGQSSFEKSPPSLGTYPPRNGAKEGTLFFHIIPYMQATQIDWQKSCDRSYPSYVAPGDPTQDPALPLTSYASNFRLFGTKGADLKIAFRRGAANIVMLMERYARNCDPAIHHYWSGGPTGDPGNPVGSTWQDTALRATDGTVGTEPGAGYAFQLRPRYAHVDDTVPQGMFSSGMHVCLGDVSVRAVGPNVSAEVWYRACDPASVVAPDW